MPKYASQVVEKPTMVGIEWDQQLQRAYDFGRCLGAELSKFEKELHAWQKTIICLQGLDVPVFDCENMQISGQQDMHCAAEDLQSLTEPRCSQRSLVFSLIDETIERDVSPFIQDRLVGDPSSADAHSEAARKSPRFSGNSSAPASRNAPPSPDANCEAATSPLRLSGSSTAATKLPQFSGSSSAQAVRNVLSIPDANCEAATIPLGSMARANKKPGIGIIKEDSVIGCKKSGSESFGGKSSLLSNAHDLDPELNSMWTKRIDDFHRLPSADRVQKADSEHHSGYIDAKDLPLSFMNKFVIDPVSPMRYLLDILSMVMVIYDFITFPLAVFDFDEADFAKIMRITTIIYWSCDVIIGLFCGFPVQTGEIEVRFWMTATKAMRTKTPLDFAIVAADWLLFALDSTKALASLARLTKVSRLIRIMRLLRLIRAAKLLEIIEKMKSWPPTAAALTFLNVSRLIFNLTIINHFLCCGWYAVGRDFSDGQESWVTKYLRADDSMITRYLVSYHWSIAQFTPCPVHIHPVNFWERLYTIIIVIFGLILFATLFGNVTAIINASRKSAYERMVAEHSLKEFLTINKVPFHLSTRIQEFLRLHRIRKTRVLESDVPQLKTLTSSLRQELHYQVNGTPLKKHPLFELLKQHHHDTLVHMCHTMATMTTFAQLCEIFHYRSRCESMLFPITGVLEYTVGRARPDKDIIRPSSYSLQNAERTDIDDGGWISEQVLWLAEWENRGRLTVREQSDVVIVDSKIFVKTAGLHLSSMNILQHYAQLFKDSMTEDAMDGVQIDDLWGTQYRFGRMSDSLESCKVLAAKLNEYLDDHGQATDEDVSDKQ